LVDVEKLNALRVKAAEARRDARGYPGGAAIVLAADRLEAELAELEATMKKS
jgi:hypothetical protein